MSQIQESAAFVPNQPNSTCVLMTIQENPHSKRNQGPNSFVKCDSKVAVLKNANNLKNSNQKKVG